MSNDALSNPDVGLDRAETLVIRVLDFITSDTSRLAHFLGTTGLRPESLQEPAGIRSLVLSVLDGMDRQLLDALMNHEKISRADIDLARARLMFEAVVERVDRSDNDEADKAIREKVKQLLRALSLLVRERQRAADKRSA